MTESERQRKLQVMQGYVAEAARLIERAKELSNETCESFEIIGTTYVPLKRLTIGGHFSHQPNPNDVATVSAWDESDDTDDSWNASGGGIGC